uniref:Uncharacterized protein LOC111124493 isoform X2 n=1 Tax=Crassostrea virginica TaxID=6565 RepID=A0A8B8D4K8_CRAVI|nr:uncharacterized protein LOC111124493 isoform X2 [Crassostrea virginica]
MNGSNSDDGNVKSPGERGAYVLLPIKGVLMVAAIALISSSIDISMGNPCELKEALDLISLNYAPFCKYNSIIEESDTVFDWGVAAFCCHSILFLVILSACMWPSENKKIGFLIIYIVVFVFAVIFIPLIFIQNNNINDTKKITAHRVDYRRLKSEMLQSLDKHFKSDDPKNDKTISSGWNKLFIQYKCCAVHDVTGTTNDFDTTPWCTTSGTCQATASQIPKTCCKDVTLANYSSAPSPCHASVNPGTYNPGCFELVKLLGVANVETCQVFMLSFSLSILAILQILDVVVAIVVLPFLIYDFIINRK